MSETLHSILDTHPDIICRFDTDLTLTYVNTAAASYFGREKPDIIGRNLLAISAEESRDAISKNVSGVSESTPTITGIQHFEEKTDFEYIHWTTSGLFDEGKLIGYQSTGRDISVRQRLTAQLEEKTRSLESAEAELRTVLNAVPALIWYKDDQNKILHLNKAAADSMNMTVEDVQGQNTYDLFGEAAKSYHEDDLRVIRSGEALRGHVEPYTPDDGQQGWVQTDKIPLMDGPDGPRILVVSTDISKLKDQEAILKSVKNERMRSRIPVTPFAIYPLDHKRAL
ncbi:MAG: PAS domain-containing protein [Pseudomonadota bacterium]